jgi:hypothetical protein
VAFLMLMSHVSYACKDCPFPAFAVDEFSDPDVPIPLSYASSNYFHATNDGVRKTEDIGGPTAGLGVRLFAVDAGLGESLFTRVADPPISPFPLSLRLSQRLGMASHIIQVELVRLSTPIPGAFLVAVGVFPSSGWGTAELMPRKYIKGPEDGIYDFDLLAIKPDRQDLALTYRTASSIWTEIPADLRAVRVHSVSNSITKELNNKVIGDASTSPPTIDYASWIGKKLIRQGESPPADDQAFILEKDIPEPHRIVGPGSVGDEMFVEGRLDIYVDDKGIITAVGLG